MQIVFLNLHLLIYNCISVPIVLVTLLIVLEKKNQIQFKVFHIPLISFL